jgi:dipeptidyl aminopeptidase/acylaminoacyl peptidase
LIPDPTPYLEECPNSYLPTQAVAGVVSYSGVYDYAAEDELAFDIMRAVKPYLRATVEGYDQRVAQASPLTYVHSGAPPFLLIHGLDDSMVNIAQSERLANALQLVNVPVDLYKVPDVDHYILMERYMPKPLTLEDMHLDEVEAWILGL